MINKDKSKTVQAEVIYKPIENKGGMTEKYVEI